MSSEIRIHFEGDDALKPGFDSFFRTLHHLARSKRYRFRVVASRSGSEACADFDAAMRTRPDAWNILLIDSEGPYESHLVALLCRKYRWNKSAAASIFWMVEMMEAWFHADKDALAGFYGQGFNTAALSGNPNVELISKKDLERGLREATKKTRKGDYLRNKTDHAAQLLATIDPDLVRKADPNCDRLFTAVLAQLS